MKKVFTVLLVLVLAVSLSIGAFAYDPGLKPKMTGTITVNGMTVGKTYNIYRIFDLFYDYGSYHPDHESYDRDNPVNEDLYVSYNIADGWDAFFATGGAGAAFLSDIPVAGLNSTITGATEMFYGYLSIGGTEKYINITDANVEQFASAAHTYALTLTPVIQHTATATSHLFEYLDEGAETPEETLPLGYYLVVPQESAAGSASVCSMDSTLPDAVINIKSGHPEISKTVDDTDGVADGQVVTYTITGEVPNTTGYTTYVWHVSDTMGRGLSYANGGVDNLSYQIGNGTPVVPSATSVPTQASEFNASHVNYVPKPYDTGFDIYFDMTAFQDHIGETVTLQYTAEINGSNTTGLINNSAVLSYSNDPADVFNTVSNNPVAATVWINSLIVDKYDGVDNRKLSGAMFAIYKIVGGTKWYFVFGAEDIWYTEAGYIAYAKSKGLTDDEALIDFHTHTLMATNDSQNGQVGGALVLDGLDNGTYYLSERVAPLGYNRLKEDIEFTLAGSAAARDIQTIHVANYTGVELPATGGIGTTVFYLIGGLMVVVAAAAFVVRKSKKYENG